MIAHNTLAASDYGLLDEKTYTPHPNYWGALLWRRLMGRTVLSPGPAPEGDVQVYAHCMRDRPGAVTVLAINAGESPREFESLLAGERYTLTANPLESTVVQLNSRDLQAAENGALPPIAGQPVKAGRIVLPATSITFLTFPKAGNHSCQ
jgi:hypothetical protein